jgi:hypothetical protein
MVSRAVFLAVLGIGLLVLAGVEVFWLYQGDDFFTGRMEAELLSDVSIKGERINDYFLERKHDVLVLADSSEVRGLLSGDVGSNEIIVRENVMNELTVIAEQLAIIVGKYPDYSFYELSSDDEFMGVVERKIGETGASHFIDMNEAGSYDYYAPSGVSSSDGVNLLIAANVDYEEFKILDNPSVDLVDALSRFSSVGGYENLVLVDEAGYVVHEAVRGGELGSNLNYASYENESLGLALSMLGDSDALIYGPYLEIGADELTLLFLAPVYEAGVRLGTIVLEDTMSDVDEIFLELDHVGSTGYSYLVDSDMFLITPIRDRDLNLLIQTIETDNSIRCFNDSDDSVVYFGDYKGDFMVGSRSLINEVGWCLVAEMDAGETNGASLRFLGHFGGILIVFLLLWGFFGAVWVSRVLAGRRGGVFS